MVFCSSVGLFSVLHTFLYVTFPEQRPRSRIQQEIYWPFSMHVGKTHIILFPERENGAKLYVTICVGRWEILNICPLVVKNKRKKDGTQVSSVECQFESKPRSFPDQLGAVNSNVHKNRFVTKLYANLHHGKLLSDFFLIGEPVFYCAIK